MYFLLYEVNKDFNRTEMEMKLECKENTKFIKKEKEKF